LTWDDRRYETLASELQNEHAKLFAERRSVPAPELTLAYEELWSVPLTELTARYCP